jgi:hypothetical protein
MMLFERCFPKGAFFDWQTQFTARSRSVAFGA